VSSDSLSTLLIASSLSTATLPRVPLHGTPVLSRLARGDLPRRNGVSGPAGTALRRQGRSVAWAEGPRHRRPRLRHRTRRRGAASAASRPTQSSRTNGRIGMLVCAAARGPVRAAAETAPPLHCPRLAPGCQATFWSPVGAATRSNGRCALPYQLAPQGTQEGTGTAALSHTLCNLERASRCRKHPLALDHCASTQETHHDLLYHTRHVVSPQCWPPPAWLLQWRCAAAWASYHPRRQRRQSQSPRPPGGDSHAPGH
jgi:hypothetical protein